MKFKLEGIQSYNFNDKKTGDAIKGNKLHIVDTRKNINEGIIGSRVLTVGISDGILDSFLEGTSRSEVVGHVVDIEFDDKKSVYDIHLSK